MVNCQENMAWAMNTENNFFLHLNFNAKYGYVDIFSQVDFVVLISGVLFSYGKYSSWR